MKPEHKDLMKARARNIRLTVCYDGTAYSGFQRQTPPVIAVQNVLERTLAKVFGDSIELAAAGRTDAGVHAYGQVVNFFTDGKIPTERIVPAVNGLLPSDIVILDASEAPRDFSARHSAKAKTYLYRIKNSPLPDPFTRNYAWHIRRPIDLAIIDQALAFIRGEHDFSSFRSSGGAVMSPVRTMYEATCRKDSDFIELRFRANGFLYHQVRNIVGTLAEVGLGKLSPQDFSRILAARDRRLAPPPAPPGGLYLFSVEYEPPLSEKIDTRV